MKTVMLRLTEDQYDSLVKAKIQMAARKNRYLNWVQFVLLVSGNK